MSQSILSKIALLYGWGEFEFECLHSGLINATWKVSTNKQLFIVQCINTKVFKLPDAIDENLKIVKQYLQLNNPSYLFPAPIEAKNGKTLHKIENEFYRVFNFVPNSHTLTVVQNATQAFEAAKQFGLFTFLLKNFDAAKLKPTLPDFHNLNLRYQQFKTALQVGNQYRMKLCFNLIKQIEEASFICKTYELFITNPAVKARVTHHDTKISNVLFNANNRAVCVIDLDTVMPGFFLSDVGDMIRTYVCPVSEEEKDYSKIEVRAEILKAIKEGYLTYMNNELTEFEKQYFFFAGEMMIYMQALRFLTDYINNDIYYSVNYPEQNLVRATNQMYLLKALQKQLKHI